MDADEQASHGNCARRVRGIQDFHMDSRGWNDIAYNFVVCKHGIIFEGRGWGVRSAAQGTNPGNDGYHAVCFLGDDTAGRDDVTNDGRNGLSATIRKSQQLYPRGDAVHPHGWFHATECPGGDLRVYCASGQWKTIFKVPIPAAAWKWARWRLSIGEYKGRGKREKGMKTRPPYQKVPGPLAWRAFAWYKRHMPD
jgi:hypothetical protein